MPLADSSRAIGAVTTLLSDRIEGITSHNVTVGRPEPPSANGGLSNPRLNLFLYEALFDATLRNTPLDDGQDAPLWLVLRFLLTPFDSAGESDTALAFGVLGDGLRALHQVAYLPLTGLQPTDLAALDVNPERLKVTFTESPASLLTSLMQGSEDRYRFSMSFEVRPIMIAPATPASYALLVGVDYTAPPPGTRGDRGLGITVEPTLGPVIERVVPASFKPGDPAVRIEGEDLDLEGLEVRLGPVTLPLGRDAARSRVFDPTVAALAGDAISAGSHALSVARPLPGGRTRSSNLAVVDLLPELTTVAHDAAAGELALQGRLLGRAGDDVIVALYRDGVTVRAFDDVFDPDVSPAPAPQTRRRVRLGTPPIPAGTYRVLLRVNGRQARESPELVLP
jgi:hypothetical protein